MEPLKSEITRVMKELYKKGHITEHGGNITARTPENPQEIWATPSGIKKHAVTPNQLLKMEIETGDVLEGNLNPTIESIMHLGIYRTREDVNAVIHSHPPFAIAWGLNPQPIPHFTPDFVITQEKLEFVPFEFPGSEELAESVEDKYKANKRIMIVILRNHGEISAGEDLEEAAAYIQDVENMLMIYSIQKTLGGTPSVLDEEDAELFSGLDHI